MRLLSTQTINKNAAGGAASYVAESEADYLWQIKTTARFLAEEEAEKPIILLTGPSGSGKTTTAFRLKSVLCEMGIKTNALSMDNYFLPVDDPRNEREPDGSIDFESPKRLDTPLLNEHLQKLWSGEEFTLPIFDFANQKQLKGKQFKRQKHEMVILEGIHALNPDVTGLVSENASGIYVSVRTRIKGKDGKFLHPSKIRLMRRFVRDKLFRGRKASQTLEFFEKVQQGEEKYILPYKCYAEHDIDTFLAYEAAIYKNFLVEDLAELSKTTNECEDIIAIFNELDSVGIDNVPVDSLVREFVGGSTFEY